MKWYIWNQSPIVHELIHSPNYFPCIFYALDLSCIADFLCLLSALLCKTPITNARHTSMRTQSIPTIIIDSPSIIAFYLGFFLSHYLEYRRVHLCYAGIRVPNRQHVELVWWRGVYKCEQCKAWDKPVSAPLFVLKSVFFLLCRKTKKKT